MTIYSNYKDTVMKKGNKNPWSHILAGNGPPD